MESGDVPVILLYQSCKTATFILVEIALNIQNNHSIIFKGLINARKFSKCSGISSSRDTLSSNMK